MWRIKCDFPTIFRWKPKNPNENVKTIEGTFRCIIDLSISGLLRKYPIYSNGLSFQKFVAKAIKQSFINQIHRRLTNENYESLDIDESISKDKIDLFNTDAIQPEWNSINSANFSLISYPTSTWIKNLFDRERNADEKRFISQFQ